MGTQSKPGCNDSCTYRFAKGQLLDEEFTLGVLANPKAYSRHDRRRAASNQTRFEKRLGIYAGPTKLRGRQTHIRNPVYA